MAAAGLTSTVTSSMPEMLFFSTIGAGVKSVTASFTVRVNVWLPVASVGWALVKVVVSAIVNHDYSVLAVTPCGEVTFTSRVPAAVRGTLVILKSL